jgi:hypothetical protein
MRKTGKFTKRIAVIGTVAALAVGGGVAWAAWLATGGGTGSASAGSATELTATVTTVSGLYPGATANVTVTINNPNPYPVAVTEITGVVTTTASASNCDPASVVFAVPAGETYGAVPANGSAPILLENAISMPNNTADNDCQGQSFTVTVNIKGASTTAAPSST